MKLKLITITLCLVTLISCKEKEEHPLSLTIYSSRKKSLSVPLFKRFEEKTKIKLKIKNGKSTALSNIITLEGENSPADLIFSQDASNLGILAKKKLLLPLPSKILKNVFPQFKSPYNLWVGTSGRARVFVYDSNKITEDNLPKSIQDLTNPKWEGKIGWAPLNGSFQSHISALIKTFGEQKVTSWLLAMKNNKTKSYPKNTPIVKATINGEIIGGLVNHYYLHKIQKDSKKGQNVKNHYFTDEKSSLINVSGVAIIKSTKKYELAQKFVEFLLSEEAQKFFTDKNYEYPTIKNIPINKSLKDIPTLSLPNINLSKIDNIQKTIKLLKETKVIE